MTSHISVRPLWLYKATIIYIKIYTISKVVVLYFYFSSLRQLIHKGMLRICTFHDAGGIIHIIVNWNQYKINKFEWHKQI